ncbi:hypothetical protein [Halobellus litoreus]|uniref:Uncharacterized protein n=1 Tax=Halobellus litoreus TaxID=755310 RepID=A0ABD6E0H6_9EURY|nr:hypothetical protein [Halobellus litoreus]
MRRNATAARAHVFDSIGTARPVSMRNGGEGPCRTSATPSTN